MPELSQNDLRAAVASGIITEAQAASVAALAARRITARPGPDDEPFELFRGFAEIFIALGLFILIAGVLGLYIYFASTQGIFIAGIALCAVLGLYFTRRRRMVLPSIVLVCGFALCLFGLASVRLIDLWPIGRPTQGELMVICAVMIAGLSAWYWLFRLPFTVLLLGLTVLAAILILTRSLNPEAMLGPATWIDLFDLRRGSGLAVGTVIFGILAAAAGIWFDMHDPHRLGRASACGFWLHLLAAPAIVNTAGLSAMGLEGGARYLAVAGSLLLLTLFALVIDRRSFLTAGLGYLIWLIWAVSRQDGQGLDWPVVLILIGGSVTALGAGWVQLRARLMRALPDFPGKDRLPPYAGAERGQA